jgi:hypothetical protein
MNEVVLVAGALLAAGLAAWLFRRRSGQSDGEWGAIVECSSCHARVPRWFLLDKGSPRGPVSMYRYPIPSACRISRHRKGICPVAWRPGESERAYNRRSEAEVEQAVRDRLR